MIEMRMAVCSNWQESIWPEFFKDHKNCQILFDRPEI